jgi:L-ribulose-5-phosphate 4-epimerase
VPALGTTHADHFHGPVPVTRQLRATEISGDYEHETGNVIVETFAHKDPLDVPAVLVASHGPFTWGRDAAQAVVNAVALELAASMALHAIALRPDVAPIGPALLDRHFFRKHGADAYYGQRS